MGRSTVGFGGASVAFAETDDEGGEVIHCPECGHEIFSRRCIEIDAVRVIKDREGGYTDDVVETDDSPVYEFHCKNCGHDCTNSFER